MYKPGDTYPCAKCSRPIEVHRDSDVCKSCEDALQEAQRKVGQAAYLRDWENTTLARSPGPMPGCPGYGI